MKKFDDYVFNLSVLEKAQAEDLSNEFIISGIIYQFIIQYELCLKLIKKLMNYEGILIINIVSPREVLKAAYSVYSFMDETIYLSMLRDRNDMTRIYDRKVEREIVNSILNEYIPEFQKLKDNLQLRYGKDLRDIIE